MPYRPIKYDPVAEAARDKNIERNLDFLHRTHMNAILYAYNEGNLPHTRELCVRAMDSHRLPAYYQNVYEELIAKIDATKAAAAVRDQATTTQELATTVLHALAISDDAGTDDKAEKLLGLEVIINKAKALGGTGNETKKKALFDQLVELAANGDGSDSAEARPSLSRRSSH